MIRKNIFKLMALALLMPAMMLLTACGNEDEVVNPEKPATAEAAETAVNKGYALPVTVNVTRQGDGTRATYNESTKKLAFSTGDKLFVEGFHNEAGDFVGTLDMVSEGIFSGTIYTGEKWTGTADALFSAATSISATLLPAGYESYGYLTIDDGGTLEKNDDFLSVSNSKAFVASTAEKTAKAIAIEQFSYEEASTYSNGSFALVPQNAVLNFTITGLEAGEKDVTLNVTRTIYEDYTVTGSVTPNGSGVATFAIGIPLDDGAKIKDMENNLTVGSSNFTLPSTALTAGKIYNITRSVVFSNATAEDVGKVIGADGNIYANASAASAAGTTAVAVIAYVGSAGSVDTGNGIYKGLAIAMSDANSGSKSQWFIIDGGTCVSQTTSITTALTYKNGIACTNTLVNSNGSGVTMYCSGHTHAAAIAARSNNGTGAPSCTSGWFLPSLGQWNLIVQGLATKKAGSAITKDLTSSPNNDYKEGNLNSVITDAGGTGFQSGEYWASTENKTSHAWNIYFYYGAASYINKSVNCYVRSVLAF